MIRNSPFVQELVHAKRVTRGWAAYLVFLGCVFLVQGLAANQLPTSVRFSGAAHTEAAAPYHHFFLDRYTPAYRAELEHFVTAVETGTAPSPGFADGRAALVLADGANESLRTGATVKVV